MFDKILVAIDGSEHSDKALETAGDLASLSKGEVRVLHVSEGTYGMGGPLIPEEAGEAEQLVTGAVEKLAGRGVTASGAHRGTHSGRVAAEIIEEAESAGSDVVVLGSTGRTALAGLLVGSVASKVIHLSKVPVVVVR